MHRFGLLVGVAAFLFPFILPFSSVDAHLFGGPPFLSVNGGWAQTNTSYLAGPSFELPQDFAPDVYLVNKPVRFDVALDKLPVPLDIAKQSTFRWTWDDSGDTSMGPTQDHTFSQVGSYLVQLEVEAPGDVSYTLLDTVRVNVVPKKDYQLPKISVEAVRDQFATNRPIQFVSEYSTDPSSAMKSITWDFNDGSTSTEVNPTHSFTETDFLHFVYVELIDKNGFKVENGITITASNGALTLSSLSATGSGKGVTLVDSVNQHGKSSAAGWMVPVIVGGILVVAVAGGVLMVRRSQRTGRTGRRAQQW